MSLPSPKEFYDRYRDDPAAARGAARDLGRELGDFYLRELGMEGGGLAAVAAVLNEFQRAVEGEPNARVEGDRVTMRCTGLCPIMRAALTLDIPWEWLDTNLAWPMIGAIASRAVPDMGLRLPKAKYRGDPECLYIFEAGS
jgi:hypothetical protein